MSSLETPEMCRNWGQAMVRVHDCLQQERLSRRTDPGSAVMTEMEVRDQSCRSGTLIPRPLLGL